VSGATLSIIPTEAMIRPCREIVGEGFLGSDYYASIADRYASLTNELPLAGSKVLRVGENDTIALIAYLRARTPWLEDAIAVIEQQLRIQLWAGRPWLAWRPAGNRQELSRQAHRRVRGNGSCDARPRRRVRTV